MADNSQLPADYALDAAEAIRLLGPARMVLDRCAEGVADPGEAADMAQRTNRRTPLS